MPAHIPTLPEVRPVRLRPLRSFNARVSLCREGKARHRMSAILNNGMGAQVAREV